MDKSERLQIARNKLVRLRIERKYEYDAGEEQRVRDIDGLIADIESLIQSLEAGA